MYTNLPGLINTFVDRHIVVLGEAMLDSYLMGSANRLCQEAPVPVVTLNDRSDRPGGAANVAVNLHALGARVSFLSVIGDDGDGDRLRQTLEHCGLETDGLLVQPSRHTLAKQRIMAASQMVVRLDQGSTDAIAPEIEQQLIERLQALVPPCDAVIISDYSYGLLTQRVMDTIATLQVAAPTLLVVDSKRLARYRSLSATVVKPNYDEACRLLTDPVGTADSMPDMGTRLDSIARQRDRLLDLTGAKMVIVTLDAEGAIILQREQAPQPIEAKPTTCRQTTGAGDTFISALTLALASNAPVVIAAELAVTAAAVVIAKDGTATCSMEELQTASAALPLQIEPLANQASLWCSGAERNPSTKEVA
ncbi:bifunctional hydroxymethylpyrimidine kinase/phosphomethylpyrimidine kinase [Leptolyngbya sp. FACHB-321]|uniref:bifunctional heptose 7-phosphate kinase/heptose 1-phosphate adenyltransferase n=1 Tax=Leptolyngbya sp. FACHB-321 TaxID=2692807 RepID=UPI001682EE6E|nr:bifunctional ADP-heptose synthase [Leptolyngbya sp. FACHB-321]MBD2034644.1 bifunctional hydroxymethylpyrimidine kinase/phosphomethylpyrimidine kinase [Leptolyngbya sp. FACHB-321]